jgi:hypothetical protein
MPSGNPFSAIGVANAAADTHDGLCHMPLHSSDADVQLFRDLPISEFFCAM